MDLFDLPLDFAIGIKSAYEPFLKRILQRLLCPSERLLE